MLLIQTLMMIFHFNYGAVGFNHHHLFPLLLSR
jgi:hypothetical protein